MKQVKCPSCSVWIDGNLKQCSSCSYSFVQVKKEKEEERKEKLLFQEDPTKFELWLEKLGKSNNPIKLGVYYVLKSIIVVYSAIVAFVVWSVIWFSG